MSNRPPRRKPLADRAGVWVILFGLAALIGLAAEFRESQRFGDEALQLATYIALAEGLAFGGWSSCRRGNYHRRSGGGGIRQKSNKACVRAAMGDTAARETLTACCVTPSFACSLSMA